MSRSAVDPAAEAAARQHLADARRHEAEALCATLSGWERGARRATYWAAILRRAARAEAIDPEPRG